MQHEQEVVKPRTKKLPVPSPSERKPVRRLEVLSSNESQSMLPADDLQKSANFQTELVYEDFLSMSCITDSHGVNESSTYVNLPSINKKKPEFASDDRTYLNHRQLGLASEELENDIGRKSTVDYMTRDLPQHGTYVQARRQASVKPDSQTGRTDTKDETDNDGNDDSEATCEDYYEQIGTIFNKCPVSKRIPSEPSPRQQDTRLSPAVTPSTNEEAPLTPETPKESEKSFDYSSAASSEIKLPLQTQSSKERHKIKTKISDIKNSIMKGMRHATNRNQTEGSKWTSVAQIPQEVDQFTIDEVSQCLRLLNLGKYVAQFKERKMNGMVLMKASEDMLKQHFQMGSLEAHQLIMFAQQRWRPE